ncbi:histidine kinase [Stenotrophomonas sp. 24(2023)]|uniref:sensor histidine kinase n=1 Tax=Stenotrophomonas sp. 24(2023) TaxID=3068324 RepID=UPI0027E0060A|nr:histidine kinase [Stenotrophomonas sp. 24(2023)]WMJ68263.1 histidine kinase [Stenotrophomonas sp. 24(2023)]
MPDALPSPPVSLLRRALWCAVLSLAVGALLTLDWNPWWAVLPRALGLGLLAMAVFSVLERWPRQLPVAVPRWVLQIVAVAMAMPLGTLAIYLAGTAAGAAPFWEDSERGTGFLTLSIAGLLVAPWVALAALVRHKDALARHQALAFALERSELERQALEARVQLLQRQVAPHFLFNTLANLQALVDSGSPQAPQVMRHLVAYLRGSVPRLQQPLVPVADEMALVTAYLELMHLRMPDRLRYRLEVAQAARPLACPGLAVLTLVENAVRHGIDPREDGGEICIQVSADATRCEVTVSDDGAGLAGASPGLGTGLATLRQRLQLLFGDAASLQLQPGVQGGAVARLRFPAQRATACA